MNKQELIRKYEDACFATVLVDEVLEDLKQLDEPRKVKIPQFVADIIEEYKDKGAPIIDIFTEKYSNKEYNTWLANELNAYDRAARAWLDGYEVEKEQKYKVKLKNTDDYLNQTETGFHFFNNWKNNEKFTRKELEYSDFGWVFDCPGVEVEEVK